MLHVPLKALPSLYSPKLYAYPEPKELKEGFLTFIMLQRKDQEKTVKRWHYHVSEIHALSIESKEGCNPGRQLSS